MLHKSCTLLLCWAHNQFLILHLDSNKLISNTKYPAFLTGFSRSQRRRICISNLHVCCYDNIQPGSVLSSGMQSPALESISFLWFRRAVREVARFTRCHPTQRWKRFSATLMRCRKHKECARAYNKTSSPSRKAEQMLFPGKRCYNNVTEMPGTRELSENWCLP